jgi:putative ABC transport system permease protein
VFFTGIALLIAVIGVVGLATYNVVRRKKEIGIKRVFGASVIQILGNLSKEFIWLITFATLLATPAVWYVSDRWLQSFAYRINMPWWIYAVTLVTIVLLTILLIVLQGLKTVRTNPTETLRSE